MGEVCHYKGMLNRADYYASSDKSYPLEIDGEYKGRYLGRLIIDELKAEKKSLRDVQKYMYDNRDENIVVVASTGSGKTEAAFMWADKSKTFYTLPLQVSINAIYDRVVNKYRYPNEKQRCYIQMLWHICLKMRRKVLRRQWKIFGIKESVISGNNMYCGPVVHICI